MEPEVVATSPNRTTGVGRSSPVPVCCGFSSKICSANFDIFSRSAKKEPPADAAPAGILYKRNPQAAARRRKWPASRSSKSEGWSQSPVLPWAQRAYETCLSAGSTAVLAHGRKTGAPTRSCTELASIPKKCIAQNALGAVKLVGARRLARPRLPDSESGGSAIPREPRAGNWRP